MSAQGKKKVFITGIAGFLGSHLAEAMLRQGHEVFGCDNLSGGEFANVPKGAEFFEADLNDFENNVRLTKKMDVIFHTAATAYDGLSLFSPYHVTQNVYANTASIAAAAVENEVERFVFCSSMARYGTQEVVPFTEELEPRPRTPYGIAKTAAEMTLKSLCELHGMKHVICVPHNIIGPRQKYDDPYRNVAALMINRMMQGKQPIIYGDGTQRRCFTFVQDAIQVLEHLVLDDKAISQVVNIGPDEEFITLNQLAQTIANQLDFDLDPIYMPPRPCETKEANCSAEKARKLFGYETRYTLEAGLKEMITWMQMKGPKPFDYHMDIEIKNEHLPRTWREQIF